MKTKRVLGHPVGRELRKRPEDLVPGSRVGPYRIARQIGDGGMATVYLARRDDARSGHRFVALKVIHPHLRADPTFTALFLDEARIASMLQHPHVCGVLDFDATEDGYYLVLEHLRGDPLAAIHRALSKQKNARRDDWPLVARIVADAAEGLHAAHELRDDAGRPLQVVHRDVSLDNVYVTFDGVVKILDFGVAKAVDQRHRTSPGILMGKHAYMAPEALRGRAPDRRVDVWGLGVVLWELSTGRRLFRRPNEIDTLRAVLELRVPPPSSVRRGSPRELDEIVMRALSREPQKRFPTARAMAEALMEAVSRRGRWPSYGDLADWVAAACPGSEERKRELVARAIATDETVLEEVASVARSFERSISVDVSDDVEPVEVAAPAVASLPPPSVPPPLPRPVAKGLGMRAAGAACLAAAIGLGGATVGWLLATHRPSGRTEAASPSNARPPSAVAEPFALAARSAPDRLAASPDGELALCWPGEPAPPTSDPL